MKTLIIKDKIYGQCRITEPVLIELIKSKPIQRLKKIDQHGAQSIVRPEIPLVTRYDHSVGVMLLLRRYNTSLEAQVTGLLHDIAHTAFSHVIDYAVGDSQIADFHERFVEKIINQSEIPEILKKYNLNLKKIAEPKNYKLLEIPEPDLCADRIDYFFHDSHICYGFLTKKQVQLILNDLKVINGKWVFTKKSSAELMAKKFIQTAQYGWYHPKNAMGFLILGQAIKIALQQKLIKEEDLFTDDKTFFNKLSKLKQLDIQKQLKLLENFQVKIDDKKYDRRSQPKFRAIDPYILKNNKLVRLSSLNPKFKKYFTKFKQYIETGIPIQIISPDV